MKKVSIIIPVYNGEKYIKECLESILKQTYKNIEIIVVDDGSIDNTKNILKSYKDKIVVKFQKNLGAPSARNNGYRSAQGDYILFFDADDYMGKDYIEHIVKIMNNGFELVISNFSRIDEYGNRKDWQFKSKKHLTDYEMLYIIPPFPNNKLYLKKVIDENNIIFEDLRMAQDLNFYLKYLQCIKKVGFNDSFDVYYREHSNSITTNYSLKIFDVEKSINLSKVYLKEENKNIFNCSRLYNYHCQLIKYSYYSKEDQKEIIKFFKKSFKSNRVNKIPIKYKKIMFKYYLNVWCMLYLPRVLKSPFNKLVLRKIA